MTTWVKRYSNKKQNTLKRNIKFELTLDEYKRLHDLSDVCDYTGVTFDDKQHKKSIERIDDKLGYSINNCCVVSDRVNLIKDCFVDKLKKCSILPEELTLIEKIKETLNTKTKEQLTAKYRIEEDIMTETEQTKPSDLKEAHSDVYLTQRYFEFSKGKEDFQLSFSEYKKLFNKKSCVITGKVFDKDDVLTKGIIAKIDSGLGWTPDNTYKVCGLVLRVKSNNLFTTKELTKLMKAI